MPLILTRRRKNAMPISKARDLALYTFRIGATSYANLNAHDTLVILQRYVGVTDIRLQSDYAWHQSLLQIKSGSFGMVAVSDFFAGTSLPPLSMWDPLKSRLAATKNIVASGNIQPSIFALASLSQMFDKLHSVLMQYSDSNQRGYSQSIDVLQYVQKSAEIGVALTATALTGGGAAGLLASTCMTTAYGGMVKTAQQSTEVYYNMRDKIDWVGIGTDMVIDELMSLAAGKIADNIISQIDTQNLLSGLSINAQQQINSLIHAAPDQLRDKIIKAVIAKGGDVLGTVVKTAISKFRDTRHAVTWKTLSDNIADEFSKMGLSGDIVNAAFN